jgi:hypothetical protein
VDERILRIPAEASESCARPCRMFVEYAVSRELGADESTDELFAPLGHWAPNITRHPNGDPNEPLDMGDVVDSVLREFGMAV